MKRIYLSVLVLILFANIGLAQELTKYKELVQEAERLYQNKEYLESGQKYSEAFAAWGNKGYVTDRYNAACSYALAGQTDSAFVQLFKIAEKGNYTNIGHLTSDTDLNSLHQNERWERVVLIVRTNKEMAEANLDRELVAILDTVYMDDQKYRMQIEAVEAEFGIESEEVQALWNTIVAKDSINLIKVTKILDTHGWLGPEIIGQQGSQTLFLVIQHGDLETQEKYLPMMREAVGKGAASASSLALLEDRVALRQGKRQIYGSQIGRDPETDDYYVLPLDDPDNVDIRREQVGLGHLQDYLDHWGLTWDVEAYKKQLPEIEAKQTRRR